MRWSWHGTSGRVEIWRRGSGSEWAPEGAGDADVLVNATPVGMATDHPGIADPADPGEVPSTSFPFPVDAIDRAAACSTWSRSPPTRR